MSVLIFSSTLTRHFCFKRNEEAQMLFTFNGETLDTFISVTKRSVCKDKFWDDCELRTTQVKANKNDITMYT